MAVQTTDTAVKEYFDLCNEQYGIKTRELIDISKERGEEIWRHNNNTSTTAVQKQGLIATTNAAYSRRLTAVRTLYNNP